MKTRPALAPLFWLAAVLVVELLIISLVYNHSFDFECRAMAPVVFCAALGFGVIRAIAVLGAVTVFLLSKGGAIARLMAGMRPALDGRWLLAEIAGFIAILIPWFFMSDAASGGLLALAAVFWLGGLALAGAGAVLSLFPIPVLVRAAADTGWMLLLVIGIAALAPEIADTVQFLWHWPAMASFTFASVVFALGVLGQEVHAIPAEVELGVGEFIVLVGRQCSGIEGFALISSFLLLYIWLFRDQLRFPRVWILLPIGILISWCFNVIRISVLILIGAHVSPDLAINGFHSHAGWLMFTLLSVGMAVLVHRTSWFRHEGAVRAPRSERIPLSQDVAAAQILPFIIFMASALLSQTFSETPAVLYPARALAMAAVLYLFRDYIRALPWRLDALAIGAGVLIGVIWIVTAPEAGDGDNALATALAAMSAPMLILWIASRLIGTVLLVPIIEELFFRGYVLSQIDRGSRVSQALAVAISSGLFAALHGRWILAAIAGVIFGLLTLRQKASGEGAGSGAITDAVLAHMVANGVIAAAALVTGAWHLI